MIGTKITIRIDDLLPNDINLPLDKENFQKLNDFIWEELKKAISEKRAIINSAIYPTMQSPYLELDAFIQDEKPEIIHKPYK